MDKSRVDGVNGVGLDGIWMQFAERNCPWPKIEM